MTHDQLHHAGSALYGPRWQTDLARELGINGRTMRRWAAGHYIPSGIGEEIARLCRERRTLLGAIAQDLQPDKSDRVPPNGGA